VPDWARHHQFDLLFIYSNLSNHRGGIRRERAERVFFQGNSSAALVAHAVLLRTQKSRWPIQTNTQHSPSNAIAALISSTHHITSLFTLSSLYSSRHMAKVFMIILVEPSIEKRKPGHIKRTRDPKSKARIPSAVAYSPRPFLCNISMYTDNLYTCTMMLAQKDETRQRDFQEE
jgi:hypothetical protein